MAGNSPVEGLLRTDNTAIADTECFEMDLFPRR
jgi:hypothetical protein